MERRKTKDFLARCLIFLNVLAGVLLIFIFLTFHFAQPEFETLFDRFYQLKLRTEWDIQYLHYLIYIVTLGIFISISGLILRFFRGRRKKDHNTVIIITGIISLIMLWVAKILL